jgi:nucleoside-diphosphate-sugar epimerase
MASTGQGSALALIAKCNLDLLHRTLLQYRRIVITGATGWLGSETAELIAKTLGEEFRHRVTLVSSTPKVKHTSNYTFQTIGWEEFKTLRSLDLLIHFAYLNQDRAEFVGLSQFIQTNRSITADVNYVLSASPGCDVLVASSGAASYYRGKIDSTNSMEVYASLKIESEESFFQNSNIGSLLNMRIWNVTGSGLDIESDYAFANFFKQALISKHIEITGNSASTRTYVDAKEMMFTFLLSLENKQKITIDSGGYRISLLGLASKVLDVLGLPSTSISLSGEFKSTTHYNPDPKFFNQLARDLRLGLSNVDLQVANYSKILAGSH